MKLPAANSGVSFCMQKSISWQATYFVASHGEFNPRKRLNIAQHMEKSVFLHSFLNELTFPTGLVISAWAAYGSHHFVTNSMPEQFTSSKLIAIIHKENKGVKY